MRMHLVFKCLVAVLCVVLPLNTHALQVSMPVYNIEIMGFLTLNGRPAQHAKVELRTGSCFGEASSFTWADEKGYYRLFQPEAEVSSLGGLSEPVYIYVESGRAGNSAYDSYCLFEGFSFKPGEINTHNKKIHSAALKENYITKAYFNPKPNPSLLDCANKKGVWGELKPKQFGCNVRFRDANKTCNDDNQCVSKLCFSYVQYVIPVTRFLPNTGSCAIDTYQALNKRPGQINGEYKAGKVIPFK